MTHEQLERRVRFLSFYAVATTVLLVSLFLTGAAATIHEHGPWFRVDLLESDTVRTHVLIARQVRVIEPDGSLALLASNADQMPGVVVEGDTITTRKGVAGLLFFNHGEEAGGLTYKTTMINGQGSAWRHLSFDQFRQDQVVYLHHGSSGASQSSGVYIRDLSPTFDLLEFKAFMDSTANLAEDQRAAARSQLRERQRRGDFGGRRAALESTERIAALRLNDYRGRERFRVVVDSLSAARLEFLDEDGEVVRSISGE